MWKKTLFLCGGCGSRSGSVMAVVRQQPGQSRPCIVVKCQNCGLIWDEFFDGTTGEPIFDDALTDKEKRNEKRENIRGH